MAELVIGGLSAPVDPTVKWIAAIEFVHDFSHLGAGQGGYNEDHEFYGYRMPI